MPAKIQIVSLSRVGRIAANKIRTDRTSFETARSSRVIFRGDVVEAGGEASVSLYISDGTGQGAKTTREPSHF